MTFVQQPQYQADVHRPEYTLFCSSKFSYSHNLQKEGKTDITFGKAKPEHQRKSRTQTTLHYGQIHTFLFVQDSTWCCFEERKSSEKSSIRDKSTYPLLCNSQNRDRRVKKNQSISSSCKSPHILQCTGFGMELTCEDQKSYHTLTRHKFSRPPKRRSRDESDREPKYKQKKCSRLEQIPPKVVVD